MAGALPFENLFTNPQAPGPYRPAPNLTEEVVSETDVYGCLPSDLGFGLKCPATKSWQPLKSVQMDAIREKAEIRDLLGHTGTGLRSLRVVVLRRLSLGSLRLALKAMKWARQCLALKDFLMVPDHESVIS